MSKVHKAIPRRNSLEFDALCGRTRTLFRPTKKTPRWKAVTCWKCWQRRARMASI